jgi:Uncharacterised protein family (UPF0158)
MKAIRVDMPYLLLAWEDEAPDNSYYLDTQSGNVKLVHRHLLDLRDLTDEIEKDRQRYLYVPKPSRDVLLKDLRDFMKTIESPSLRPVLEMAFESPHVLSSFRKILEKHDHEAKRFAEYRQAHMRENIDQWLAANAFTHDGNAVNPLDENSLDFYENENEDNDDDFAP